MSAWAYIAHKNGYWAGLASAELDARDLRKFVASFVGQGFSITTVEDRDEYNRVLDGMQEWSNSPEYKAKHSRTPAPATLPLFGEA